MVAAKDNIRWKDWNILSGRIEYNQQMEGVGAMKAHRERKVTLRTHTVAAPKIKVSPGAYRAKHS
jgi:hypothetical protein